MNIFKWVPLNIKCTPQNQAHTLRCWQCHSRQAKPGIDGHMRQTQRKVPHGKVQTFSEFAVHKKSEYHTQHHFQKNKQYSRQYVS